jgi:chitodextrinase
MKYIRFFILALMCMLISTWSTNFNAEGAKIQTPTLTPTGFSAIAVSPTQIDLSWIAPTQNYGKVIVGYKIEQRLSNGIYDTIVDNTGSTITTYSLTGLKTGLDYTYRVSAIYSDDTSTDPSNSATVTPLTTSTPPPTPIISSPITHVKFDFVPSDGTILMNVIISQSDYLGLQYKKDPRSMVLDAVPTTESINNNLDRLMAYQTNHVSPDSIPAPLVARSVSSTQINLSWMPPLESYGQVLQGYKIELKSSSGDYQVIDDNTGNDTTKFVITGLTPESTYTFRVSAVYPGTHSNPSNEASATTLVQSNLIEKPNVTIQNSSSNVTINSSPSTGIHNNNIDSSVSQVINVQFDYKAPDGSLYSGAILSQGD